MTIKISQQQQSHLNSLAASMCRSTADERLLWLYTQINDYVGIVGEEKLKEKYGKDKWEAMKFRLERLTKLAHIIHSYRLNMPEHHLVERNPASKNFVRYQKAFIKLSIYEQEMYQLYTDLINMTTMKDLRIPTSYFQQVKTNRPTFGDRTQLDEMGSE